MDLELGGKLALVSGSTAGIGFAIARALLEEGARVVVNGRTKARVEAAVERLRSQIPGAKVDGLPLDLGTAEGCREALARYSDVDILVNNLGIFEPKSFADIPDEDWLRLFEVNVLSGVRLSRHYLPRMKQKGWGRIIFISSESAIQVPVDMIHYGMTKTAQLAIARGMAETTKGSEVTVNSVLAGPTDSEGVSEFIDRLAEHKNISRGAVEKDFFEHERPTSLLQRFEKAEEIAAVVAFVASPVASAVNGAALRADGGVVRSVV